MSEKATVRIDLENDAEKRWWMSFGRGAVTQVGRTLFRAVQARAQAAGLSTASDREQLEELARGLVQPDWREKLEALDPHEKES